MTFKDGTKSAKGISGQREGQVLHVNADPGHAYHYVSYSGDKNFNRTRQGAGAGGEPVVVFSVQGDSSPEAHPSEVAKGGAPCAQYPNNMADCKGHTYPMGQGYGAAKAVSWETILDTNQYYQTENKLQQLEKRFSEGDYRSKRDLGGDERGATCLPRRRV